MNPLLPEAAQFNVTIQDQDLPGVHVALTLHASNLPDEGRRLYLDRLSACVEKAVRDVVASVQDDR